MHKRHIPIRRISGKGEVHLLAAPMHQARDEAVIVGIGVYKEGIRAWDNYPCKARDAERLLGDFAMQAISNDPKDGVKRVSTTIAFEATQEILLQKTLGGTAAPARPTFTDLLTTVKNRATEAINLQGNLIGVTWVILPSTGRGKDHGWPIRISTMPPHTPEGELGLRIVQALADLHHAHAWIATFTGLDNSTRPPTQHFYVLGEELGADPSVYAATFARSAGGVALHPVTMPANTRPSTLGVSIDLAWLR